MRHSATPIPTLRYHLLVERPNHETQSATSRAGARCGANGRTGLNVGTTTRLPHCWLRLGALVWLVVLSGAIELQAEDPTQCSTALRAVEDQRGTALRAVEAPANENLLHNHWLLTGQVAADTQSADSLDSQNWLVDPRTADPYVLPVAMLASGAHAPSRVPLSQLSDAELLQLYTQMYQQSFGHRSRRQRSDGQSRAAPPAGWLHLQLRPAPGAP